MIRCDAMIAGAGPAGSIAALGLARAGFRVAIADGAAGIGPKVGESLPGAGLRLLRKLRIDDSDFGQIHRSISGNLSCWGFGFLEANDFFRDPDGPNWRLTRRRFDASLLAAAFSAGTQHIPSNLVRVTRNCEQWEGYTSSGETFAARWLVEATGRSASIARQIGVSRIRDEGLIAVCGFGSRREGERFDRTLIEAVAEGWWYGAVLPDDLAVLMLHVRPQAVQMVRREWRQCLERTAFVREFFPPSSFSDRLLIADAAGGRLQRFHGTNWIACGDAAMSFDPLSSQGILSAMYSGLAAARAIAAAESGESSALTDYAHKLEEIRRVYRARLMVSYRSVRRWPSASFWREYCGAASRTLNARDMNSITV